MRVTVDIIATVALHGEPRAIVIRHQSPRDTSAIRPRELVIVLVRHGDVMVSILAGRADVCATLVLLDDQ